MVAFVDTTWFLLWALVVVLILRWFHVVSADRAWDDEFVCDFDDSESSAIAPPLNSSLSSGAQA